jgi:membrane-bound inhibitor of C-type lysozyme
LRTRRLLDARHTRMLLASRVLDDSGNRYGYGLVFQFRPNGHWIGRDSEARDGSAEMWFSPTMDDVVIVLSNTNATSGANFVMDRLPKP